ncbi:MAG TPA: RNA polymerase sigma factor [Candidatus Limnocylindrales bacterium]|nr:RNA polymerase sigma factor [Candidatus Limnocylindrales bacterium]
MAATAHADFADLVGPHLDHVYGLALRLSGDRSAAEDIVQDALVRAYKGMSQLRDRGRVRFWLTKVVYSAWHDRHRKEADHERDISLDDARFSLFDRLVEEDPFPYSDRLHLDFLELFDSDRICEALGKIHPAHRTALVLAYVYGYKAREIAELTGTTTGTVLARLHRGRKQLERALWDYATERGLLREGVRR